MTKLRCLLVGDSKDHPQDNYSLILIELYENYLDM